MPVSPPTTRKRYYSATEVQHLFNVSPSTIDQWIRRGILPTPIRHNPPRGKRYWTVEQIDKLLAEMNTTG